MNLANPCSNKSEHAPMPPCDHDCCPKSHCRIAQLESANAGLAAHVVRLREAIPFPKITFGNLDAILYHTLQGEPFGGLSKEALESFRKSILDQIEAYHRALESTPRDSLKEVLEPVIELLERCSQSASYRAAFNLVDACQKQKERLIALSGGLKKARATGEERSPASGQLFTAAREVPEP